MARVKFLLLLCFPGFEAQPQGGLDLGALLGGLGGLDAGPPAKQGKGGARASLCPSGETSVPKLDQHKRMIANGCGPEGLIIKEPYGLWRCCNGHDVCFSVCGTSHNFCEDYFARCMDEVCEQLPNQKPLRHCAPISLASPVTDSVCSALKTVIQSTCAFHRTEATALNETERASFANFCQVLGKQVMPYMKECLEAFFPSSVLTNLYGGSFLDVRLDVDALLVLLEPVMPQDSTQEKDKPPHQKNEAKNSEYDRRKDQENSESNESRLSKVEPNKDVNEKLPDSVQRTQDLTQVEAVSR